MYDVDYTNWVNYIETIFKKNSLKPDLIVDLGCGTGNITIEMAKRDYEVIGIDISADMLACAKEKSLTEDLDVLFLNQDMCDFELYGTVDAIVCLMDSINYVTNKKSLKKMFSLVMNYLNPGGLFIFDINTEFKLETMLGNNVFYEIADDITYIWQNSLDKKKKLCKFDLTFFVKEEQGYERYDETHVERAYSCTEIEKMLSEAGLKLVSKYDQLTFKKPSKTSQRVFYVSRKEVL